jgi:ribosomal protein S18 acetylase RimI-like enzyme
MHEMTVRPAVPGDAESVLRVHVRARTSYYRGFLDDDELAAQNEREVAVYERMITSPQRTVRCAEVAGRLVGFVVVGPPYHPDPDGAVGSELYQLHVDPGHHRTGVGSRLHDAALQVWRGSVSAARLWVWEFNERARAFYERHGWTADGSCRPDDPRVGRYRMLGYRLDIAH